MEMLPRDTAHTSPEGGPRTRQEPLSGPLNGLYEPWDATCGAVGGWGVWRVIAEIASRDAVLAHVRAVAGFDYRGVRPSTASLWWQVNDVHLSTMGKKRDHDYRMIAEGDSR